MTRAIRFPACGSALPVALALLFVLALSACGQDASSASSNASSAPPPDRPPSPSVSVTTRPAPGRPTPKRRLCAPYCESRLDGGLPYEVATAATDAECCDACSADAMCGSWVRDKRTALCALKNETFSMERLMADANFTAGESSDVVVGPDDLEFCPGDGTCVSCLFLARVIGGGVDDDGGGGQTSACSSSGGRVFRGATINGGGQRTRNAQACCDLCQRRDGACFLWSWRRSDRRCFLRSRWGGVANNGNFVSGSLL
ncbi:unnamed protein product [Ostreobium quekettii]|uniref:Apple domain-containing protein n=1 Tax=Ostreobium quekettii TaxID=121088 RepID=A0A8S1IS89_9CHLO|nr:unnamed protein product [Ostreobium quekettii]